MNQDTIEAYSKTLAAALHSRKPFIKKDPRLPSFSIVTIVLNAKATLERTIQSVIKQNYPNLEYVIVDGGSTDGSLEIIKKYSAHISTFISEKDRGIADAFNKGVVLAQGEWVGILNADDWYEDGALHKVAPFCEQADILTAQTRFWKSDKPSYVFHSAPERLSLDTTIGHQSVFVKRSLHDQYGLYRTDLRFASDYDFFLKTYINGVKFKTLDFVVANMQDEGVSDTHWPRVYKEVAQVQAEHLGDPWKRQARYYYKLVRTHVSRNLTKAGLEPVVSLYRRYFSVLRKDRVG